MGQKTVRFSDLSGQLIMREENLARIVIQEHPELGDGPVEIETLADEALGMEKDALRVAVLDLYLPGEDLPRTDAKDIYERLEHSVDMVLDGGNCGLIPTSVIDLSGDRAIVVREGRGDVSPFET